MELDQLKADWNNITNPAKTNEEIQLMLQENRHPVLKQIRRQLFLECASWIALLFCYYSLFDGDKKPVYINAILVACIILPLIHNLMGYRFNRYLINGDTIKQSIQNYLTKVKVYAAVSVAARALYFAGLMVFFSYGVTYNKGKNYLVLLVVAILATSLVMLSRIWMKRLRKLRETLLLFD
jgi:hypothetical protein